MLLTHVYASVSKVTTLNPYLPGQEEKLHTVNRSGTVDAELHGSSRVSTGAGWCGRRPAGKEAMEVDENRGGRRGAGTQL